MPIQDKNRVYDGFDNLAGGVDDGREPHLIDRTQVAEAENVVFRGGKAGSRPGFRPLQHHFTAHVSYLPSGSHDPVLTPPFTDGAEGSQAAFQTRKFQGASYFAPPGIAETIMASIGGRLFQITPERKNHLDIRELLPSDGRRNDADRPLAYMTQADRFHITQDGESKPIIFDGVTARRAREDEVPTGTIMAFGMGRLVVVRGQEIIFGDLIGSHADLTPGEAVLKFTETTFLNEGGAAAISTALGRITAAFFTPQQDSSTGDGELLVSADNGIVSFFLSQPREVWKESAFQRIALQNIGVRGHRSPVSKNGDVWFRADDGCRSYRQARSEINGWAHLPLSTNVAKWIENDTPALLEYASSVAFDNRILFTCSPIPNQGRLYHNGLLSLDFDVLSSFGEASKPAWDGHWSGHRIMQLVAGKFAGVERAFAFVIDNDGKNAVIELTKTGPRLDFGARFTSSVTCRSMSFRSEQDTPMPFNEKELIGADLWIDDVMPPTTLFAMDYRPDHHPEWTLWKTNIVIDGKGECGAITCGGCPTVRKNFVPRLTIGKPADTCDDDYTKRHMRRGYEFQPRIRWYGPGSVRRLRLHAILHPEDPKAVCYQG